MYGRIREEGNARSRIMDYAAELIDGIGPRLTGSPNLNKATGWARKTLADAGCANVRLESWGEFGLGWQERNTWLRMTQNRFAGNSAFTSGGIPNRAAALFERLGTKQLDDFATPAVEQSTGYRDQSKNALARFDLMEKAGRFFAGERVAAVIVPSGNNPSGGASGGTIHVDTNYTFGWFVYQRAHAMEVPLVVAAIEHYGRLSRLLQRGVLVQVELNVETEFSSGNPCSRTSGLRRL